LNIYSSSFFHVTGIYEDRSEVCRQRKIGMSGAQQYPNLRAGSIGVSRNALGHCASLSDSTNSKLLEGKMFLYIALLYALALYRPNLGDPARGVVEGT